ncbi:MAG: glycosyltransferase family 4 protein [Janthinobacterium lividum]
MIIGESLHPYYLWPLLAFVISVVVTLLMIRIPIYDVPNERSSHQKMTPRGAGLGILLAFTGVWMTRGLSGIPFYDLYIGWMLCLGASVVMGLVGFMDDLFNIKESTKLMIQLLIVFSLTVFGIRFFTFPLPILGDISLNMPVSIVITTLWIVGFMNAYNFMDGLNGMTGIVTIIASFFWFLITHQLSCDVLSYSALILIFALLGFLGFNFPKAKIFLGDVGSLFMGSLFAFWAILGTLPQFGRISLWTVPMLFCLYLYDVIFTRIRRLYRGYPFMSSHREHLYQLLNRTGWSHAQVVSLYGGFFCLQGITAYFMQEVSSQYHLYFFFPFIGIYGILTYKILIKSRQHNIHV